MTLIDEIEQLIERCTVSDYRIDEDGEERLEESFKSDFFMMRLKEIISKYKIELIKTE